MVALISWIYLDTNRESLGSLLNKGQGLDFVREDQMKQNRDLCDNPEVF